MRFLLFILVLFGLISCGKNAEIQHDYPVQVQVQVAKNQAKYESLDKEFELESKQCKDSKNEVKIDHETELCRKIEFLSRQFFLDAAVMESSKTSCVISAKSKDSSLKVINVLLK